MPGNERIESIIDLTAVDKEAKLVMGLLAEIDSTIKAMPQLFKDYKGASTLADIKKGTDDVTAATRKMTDMQKQLDAQKLRAINLNTEIAKQLEVQKQLNQQRQKDLKSEAKDTAGLNNEYQKLVLQYQKALNTAQAVGAEHGVMSKQFQEAAENANKFRAQLNTIDYSLGNYQRNVGNYHGSLGILSKALKGFGGLGIILDKALGIDPQVFDGIREAGRGLRDLQHAKEIETLTEKEGIAVTEAGTLAVTTNGAATKQATLFQRIYTAVVGESTGALKVLKIALAATGIGLLLLLIPVLAAAMDNMKQKTNEAAEAQKQINDILKEGRQDSAAEIARAKELYAVSQDLSQSIHTRKEATAELLKINKDNNERTGEHTKLLQDQNGVLKANEQSIDRLTQSLFKQAATKAAMKQLEAAFSDIIEEQTKDINDNVSFWDRVWATVKATAKGQGMVGAAYETTNIAIKNQGEAIDKATQKYDRVKKVISEGLANGTFSLDGIFDEGKGKSTKATNAIVEKNKEAIYKIAQAKLQEEIKVNQEIAANENQTFGNRLKALKAYQDKSLQMINLEAQFEKSKKGTTEKEKLAIDAEAGNKRLDLVRSTYKEISAIVNKESDEVKKGWDSLSQSIKAATDDAIERAIEGESKILEKRHEKREADKKDHEQFEKKKADLEKQLAKEIFDTVKELADASFERKKNQLQDELDAINVRYETEVTNINNSTLADQDKADKLKILEATKLAQVETIDRRKRQLDLERARFDKAANIAKIIEETAVAIVSALKEPHGLILAAIVGAIGAAELARAIAVPVPKYAEGTDFAKGGPAIVGEKGEELFVTPSGEIGLTPGKPTLTFLKRGTQIIPHDQMMKMLEAGVSMNIFRNATPEHLTSQSLKSLEHAMKDTMIWQTGELVKASRNKKPVNIHVSGDFKNSDYIRKSVYE
jgi:hypothetical protein